MHKILTILLLSCSLVSSAQYKKHKKSKTQINTKVLTIAGGTLLETAGCISIPVKNLLN